MSQHEKLFDLILLGSGENGKEIIQGLEEQGKRVLYINLQPELIASMSVQVPYEYTSDERNEDKQPFKILAHTQTLNTSTYELRTYMFQAKQHEESLEVSSMKDQEVQSKEIEQAQPTKFESTVLKSEKEKHEINHVSKTEENNSLHKEENLEKVLQAFDEVLEVEEPTEKMKEEVVVPKKVMDEVNHSHRETASTEVNDSSIEQKIQPFILSEPNKDTTDSNNEKTLDILKARELSLRKKLFRRKNQVDSDNSSSFNQAFSSTLEVKPETEESKSPKSTDTNIASEPVESLDEQPIQKSIQEETDTNGHEHSSESLTYSSEYDREVKLRKKFLGRSRHSLSYSELEQQEEEAIQGNNEDITKQTESRERLTVEKQEEISPESLSLESFTSRRRSRAKKKNRLFANIVNRPPQARDNPPSSTPVTEANNQQSKPLASDYFPQSEDEIIDMADFNYNSELNTNSSPTLKRDTIEFEDAYGYNQWEEFFTPFSHSSRKRQEMNKIEKRKIALRGLHNLINNLG
ncbi:hypothetical protein [Thermoflavimicrobium daqui]|uniref:Uncharacterized protein n=1 Tax=Thermoflavimicrobium daqui TaxID=2137476 RepID=A0A364K3I2_9BACL|nr:hypothetical protein [Thermoflavimicrobium daqui]RAL23405.1 hypothetical protein DL897_12005 [Thermoflavimicrobium daqui]